jgi:hypothetical protein
MRHPVFSLGIPSQLIHTGCQTYGFQALCRLHQDNKINLLYLLALNVFNHASVVFNHLFEK